MDTELASIPSGNMSPTELNTPWTVCSQDHVSNDVAVVGMACRVAGGNNSLEQLWQFLLDKKDASGNIPPARWEAYYRRNPRNAKVLDDTTSQGYFLDHLEDFDCYFFGISPKEAEQMDPQQRISLEMAWEALENAGIPSASLSGSDTAVFWGVNSDDYSKLVLEDLPNVEAWMGIGTAYCGVPNRISYHLNLMGPSTAVDAAFASSLVAIHHGVQAIRLGETKLAIIGGVNALCGPGLTRVLDKAGAISKEGACWSFDDKAKGYGRGEGAGAVVLKSLQQAVLDNDHVLAVIKGSAVGHDGKTNGIMAPNGKAQQLTARNALTMGNIDTLSIRYVEAHATSTLLGDPTEVSALAGIYGVGRDSNDSCLIGSIKPNIGHLEAGAGVMGFIKTTLATQKGILPPQTNLDTLNSRIDWASMGVKVVQEATRWPESDPIHRAALCSYGYGGTVSHAVIEGFPSQARQVSVEGLSTTRPNTLQEWITSPTGRSSTLDSISTTLATRLDHHEYRTAIVVDSHDDAEDALGALTRSENHPFTAQGRMSEKNSRREVVWVFSSHGAQWGDMGKELIHNPIFREAIEPLEKVILAEIGLSPIELLQAGEFESSDHVQILTYVMQIGLAAILRSRGVFPQEVMGHSVGEIAASVVAGALTTVEGALIVTRRAALYRRVMGQGGMILVQLPADQVERELSQQKGVAVAIESSPSSCVISGDRDAVLQAAETLLSRGVKTFTSLAEPLRHALAKTLSPCTPFIPLYSTSLRDPHGQDLRDTTYWINNMVNRVRLKSAVRHAVEDGYKIFLEVSSHPVVAHSIGETLIEGGWEDTAVIPTLLRHRPVDKQILYSVAQLRCHGAEVNWKAQLPGPWADGLPTTTWMHKPIWRKIETAPLHHGLTHDVAKPTLLGQRIGIAGTDMVVYTTRLDNETKPFPGSHSLHGTEIVPAAVLVLHNVVLRVPVAINVPRSVQVQVQQDQVKIVSQLTSDQQSSIDETSSWVTHTTSCWSNKSADSERKVDITAVKKRLATTRVYVSPDIDGNATLPWDSASWAPILDAATSVGSTVFSTAALRMPAQIEQVQLLTLQQPPKVGWLYVQEAPGLAPTSHVQVLDEDGGEIEGTPGVSGSMGSLVYQLAWIPATPAERPLSIHTVILISADCTAMARYGESLPSEIKSYRFSTAHDLISEGRSLDLGKGTVVEVPAATESFTSLPVKLFILTSRAAEGETVTALAHAPLFGLARIISSEHPNIITLIDSEMPIFPWTTMKDGVARTARLRSLSSNKLCATAQHQRLVPRGEGTYLITANFLVEKGARRIILVSRRAIPPRATWSEANSELQPIITQIQDLEARGATVCMLALDLSRPDAAEQISIELERLAMPRVLGVTTRDAFARVLAPKVNGALALHKIFPPKTIDFFVLFSSCGNLFGFPGQASYASANAFLDWTAWRGMGMGASTSFIDAELESRGITDVTRNEAFSAWQYVAQHNMDEPLPTPLLNDIAVRRSKCQSEESSVSSSSSNSTGSGPVPTSGPELKAYLDERIRDSVAKVLHMAPEDVDSRRALLDLGVDSVMTVSLRRELAQALKVKVPPTLTWSHPTVSHLVRWFEQNIVR
ncbi:6-methylsalicylic acid synthase [Aspergillus californicus]